MSLYNSNVINKNLNTENFLTKNGPNQVNMLCKGAILVSIPFFDQQYVANNYHVAV